MKRTILNLINDSCYVSILDIVDLVPGFNGNYEWYFNTNTCLWNKCSEEGIRITHSLLVDKVILAYQDSMHMKFMYPGIAPYKIAKSLTKDYVKPRWMPIGFTTQNRIDRDGVIGFEPIDLSTLEFRPTPIRTKNNGPKAVFPYFE
jgi:hypothetical protein